MRNGITAEKHFCCLQQRIFKINAKLKYILHEWRLFFTFVSKYSDLIFLTEDNYDPVTSALNFIWVICDPRLVLKGKSGLNFTLMTVT